MGSCLLRESREKECCDRFSGVVEAGKIGSVLGWCKAKRGGPYLDTSLIRFAEGTAKIM